ncbi:MAG: branched-chain amino acid ABC transporter permease [bacterium]|nr:branched-chain amino acid ABC transporter permease [bacterium]MDE0668186.1 branched-chain amino acid ABC transporter permease [bacterium]
MFDPFIVKASLVTGVALGALYGILAVGLVLSFRMSRMVAFVHGGIALCSAFLYWYLTADPARTSGHGTNLAYATKEWPKAPAVILAMLLGVGLAALFAWVATGRMASWPRVTVTTFALGGMLIFTGITQEIWPGAFEIVPSPFGRGRVTIWGANVSHHQIAVIGILVFLVIVLHFVVTRTKTGVQMRAISDDVEAAEIVGIPVRKVSMGVWCLSGALAGLGGVLLTPMTRLGASVVLFVLIRSLAGAVLGGFRSLPLALLGAMLFGQVEAHTAGGTFGKISSGWREVILMAVLFLGVLLVVRRKRSQFRLAET